MQFFRITHMSLPIADSLSVPEFFAFLSGPEELGV